MSTMPRDDDVDFSEQDLFTALKLFHPESEAAVIARTMTGPLDPAEVALGASRSTGIVLSDDLLVVMSLISDELARKVARYIARDPALQTPEGKALWEKRRLEIERWLKTTRGDPE
jgi:hypothetical protein